jgi:hypothetical protein
LGMDKQPNAKITVFERPEITLRNRPVPRKGRGV